MLLLWKVIVLINNMTGSFFFVVFSLRLLSAIKGVNGLLALLNFYWMQSVRFNAKTQKDRLSSFVMWDEWSSEDTYPRLKTSHAEGIWCGL